MAERTSHPEPGQAAFSVAIATGMRMAAELVYAAGPDSAINAIGRALHDQLSETERGILAAAVALVVDMRNVPDDPSTMPAPAASSCPDSSCRVCPAIGGQAA